MAKRVNVFSVKLVKESAKTYDIDVETKRITSPECAVRIVNEVFDMENLTKEHFIMLALGTKNNIVGAHVVHVGSVNAAIVHPREVFQLALLNNATSIMCFHNHPSGDPQPSNEDIHVTKRLREAGNIIGIELLDHIVVGHGRFVSLRQSYGNRSGY